jgi:hypothetical protein
MIRQIVERAQAAGDLRPDVSDMDIPMLNVMTGSVAEFAGDVDPELFRRYLGILLDGLRARRDAPSPLPTAPLDLVQLDEAMSCRRPRSVARG